MAPRKKNIDFETSLQELENIVLVLEEGNLGLEDSLKSFEKGIKITRECQQALRNAEQRVRLLSQQTSGELTSTEYVAELDE